MQNILDGEYMDERHPKKAYVTAVPLVGDHSRGRPLLLKEHILHILMINISSLATSFGRPGYSEGGLSKEGLV